MQPTPQTQPPFATYLLPSISFPLSFPFRRRQSSTTSTNIPSLSGSPTSTPSSSPPAGAFIPPPSYQTTTHHDENLKLQSTHQRKLTAVQPSLLRCTTCSSDIAHASQIVSKGFTGRHGRAYLVSLPSPSTFPSSNPGNLTNTTTGRAQNRELLTGQHVVADVSCLICGTVLGWKYVDAKEASQRYKIGKCILEMKRVGLGRGWEDTFEGDREGWNGGEEGHIGAEKEGDGEDGEIVFDSGDEDECEDLFAGVWDKDVVGKRRGRRVGRKK